jgi:ribosomal protein L11 methyltransferase
MSSRHRNKSARWVARLETDERSGRGLSSQLAESFELTRHAVSLVDNGGGRWEIVIHFGSVTDQQKARALVAATVGSAEAKRLRFQCLATHDWVKASLEGLSPVEAGQFLIHGAHDRARVPSNRIGIEIEAALAFGTGHHGTTRGCLFALNELCKRLSKPRAISSSSERRSAGRRILDLGSGSGVLAIAASRALRRRVVATDIDPGAVRVARANAHLNRAGPMVEVLWADGLTNHRLRACAPFDLIFANILLGPLQRLAAPLLKIAAPGARIILSGLLSSQANAAIAAYRPLALERRINIDGWTTLVLTRRIRPRHGVAARRRGS